MNILCNWFQMELGSQATPFEHRSFGEELNLSKVLLSEHKVVPYKYGLLMQIWQ